MEYKFIRDTVDLITKVGNFDEREFRGCTESQIEALEHLLPEYSYLPESYYEFLKFGGNGICSMLSGTDFYFPQVYALRAERKLQNLKSAGFFSEKFDYDSYLKNELFLFYYHQGYFARFFYMDGSDDPNIYYYEAGLPYDFLLTQEQSFSQYLYTEVASFITQYQQSIVNVDIELRNRVKFYRNGLLDTLDALESIPVSTGTKLTQDAKRRYAEIIRNTYRLLFDYPFYALYEYDYVFSPKNYSQSPEMGNDDLQELVEMMYELEKEGKDIIFYVNELKKNG
ncbi:MAG: hypothetical protein RIB93_29255 [Coleofasciculus sp. D1-CHI-01]|uniref:SMI1/KNR4 family protein n=1 Tax=Coleofasciculus sp. D1-CHI-01 TaxID=3068482 RepID=UPI0032F744A2